MSDHPTPASLRQSGIPQNGQTAGPKTLPELLAQWRQEEPLAPEDQFPEIIDPRTGPEGDL